MSSRNGERVAPLLVVKNAPRVSVQSISETRRPETAAALSSTIIVCIPVPPRPSRAATIFENGTRTGPAPAHAHAAATH